MLVLRKVSFSLSLDFNLKYSYWFHSSAGRLQSVLAILVSTCIWQIVDNVFYKWSEIDHDINKDTVAKFKGSQKTNRLSEC